MKENAKKVSSLNNSKTGTKKSEKLSDNMPILVIDESIEPKKSEKLSKFAENLPAVEVIDETTTKGKVSDNVTLTEKAEAEAKAETLKKNEVFAEVSDYFCPVKYDGSELAEKLQSLVNDGLMTEEAKNAAMDKSKKVFLDLHKEEIEQSEKLSFAEVVEKLKENQTLYKKVLDVCAVSDLLESRYIKDGKVQIFRGSQFFDKENKPRYTEGKLNQTENGQTFTTSYFVEYREISTSNVILAIRYYSNYQECTKKLLNLVSDYKTILTRVEETAKRAKENKFTLEQVLEVVRKVFNS